MHRMLKILLVIAALLYGIPYTMAFNTIESYQNQLQGKIKKGDTLIVKDEKFLNNAFDWTKIHNKTVNNIVTFGLYRDSGAVITQAFNCEVTLKIEYWSQPDQADPVIVDNVKLKITYDPAAGVSYQDAASYSFMNGYKIKITVNDIASADLGTSLPAAFRLTGQVVVERSYEFDGGVQLAPNILEQTANKITLSWNKITGAEEYDLEWTFIDEESDNGRLLAQQGSSVTEAQLKKMFRNNSTRVTVQQEYYDISLVHLSKYLLVRMRVVYYDSNGFRTEQPWDYQLDQGGTTGPGVITLTNTWHQPGMNWQYSATYAEDGKKKEVVTYFDGTLRNRQVVTVNNSDNKAITQESLYDEFGRPAISILPAPLEASSLTYYGGLHLKANGQLYTYADAYGTGTDCINKPSLLATTAGASKYYSPANTFLTDETKPHNKYIPDAEGYPFSVTRYTPDNTGRVLVQGGVGSLFQPGTDSSKATRYFYGKPTQRELDRMFGNDVGYANHYLKNMVVDGNGQISISYQNASGKTIATALAGASPANVDSLSSKPAAEIQALDLLTARDYTFDAAKLKLTATATYLAETTGPAILSFNVSKLIKTYTENNVTICSNCVYQLKYTITDNCNNRLKDDAPVSIGSATSNCGDNGYTPVTANVTFSQIGEYHIYVELGLTEEAIRNYTNDFVQRNTNLKTEWRFVLDELYGKDFTACFDECTTCQDALGTKANFTARFKERLATRGVDVVTNNTSITAFADSLYDHAAANCAQLRASCLGSPCADLENALKADVSPGGQYALFDGDSALEKSINVLYLNWRNVFPVKQVSDPEYTAAQFIDHEGIKRSPYDADFTITDLVKYWQKEWADSFVKYHPEYCALQFCQGNSAYLGWDQRLSQVAQTVSEIPAASGGAVYSRTTLAWLADKDPFFSNSGAAYKSAFLSDLGNYTRQFLGITGDSLPAKSLSGYVDYMLYCNDKTATTNSTNRTAANASNWNSCNPVAACRIPDKEWQLYRDKYLELKEKYYQQLRAANYCNNACVAGDTLSYTPANCPARTSFYIRPGDSTCSASGAQPVQIVYAGSGVEKKVTLQLYYPDEYLSLGAPMQVTFLPGQQKANICVPAGIDINAIGIAWSSCEYTSTEPNYSCSSLNRGSFGIELAGVTGTTYNYRLVYQVTGEPIPAGVNIYVDIKYVYSNTPGAPTTPVSFIFNSTTLSNSFSASAQIHDWDIDPQGINGGIRCTGITSNETVVAPEINVRPGCDIAYRYKQSRTGNISYSMPAVSTDTVVLKNMSDTQLATEVAANCTAQADNWIAQLEPCINGNATIRNQLRTKLIELCKLGGDLNHPNGSSTAAPGKMTADGDTSFRQVIKRVLGISQFTMTCNPWLLDAPYEYRKPALSASVFISSTNAAICNILTRERNAMPQGVTFYNYLKGRYKDAMTLSEAELTMLESGCGNCRYLLAKEIQLPSFLQQGGDGCVTPAMFQQGVTALQQEMGGNLNTIDANYETVFKTYLNHRWGFTLAYDDYATFNDTITKNPSASLMLCNRPAFSAVKQDPYGCMLEVVDDAVASGHVLYNEYIEEVRKNFRKDYIAYCSANKPSATLTVPYQKYHYTLYYYDQAGNLTRTVPPEGVHLLDTSWLPQVGLARDEANASCTYTGPANNTSKDTAFKYITAALNPPGKSTLEMWINNADPNKTASQVLATTANRKYLLNVCLSRHYVNIDIYSLVPTADGKGVEADTSWHTTADMQSVLPLKQWTHVAILKNGVSRDNMAVYVNGVLLPLSSVFASGGCGWDISAMSGSPVYPENLSYLKQLRIYNRLLTGDEIAANADEICMSISPVYATGLQSSLEHWGRFNTPVPDGSGSTAETTVVPVYPEHGLATSYAYQSLNGITVQNTPDAGKSRFWYDRLGRMVTSQNAEQLAPYYAGFVSNRYSYTRYDEQGRITEVGEKTGATSPATVPFLSSTEVNSFLAGGTNAQITRTYYDAPFTGTTSKIPLAQENLRKRVSAVIYREAATDSLQQATYYSYDQLGNVKTLWQQIQSLDIKQVDYQYDLVSGKVNKVRYQPNQTDKFFYGYQYDAENRLIKAVSGVNALSSDGWEIENPQTDAAYQYYLHGPLARTELGNTQLVQGLDYAYTLQGWLKGVNGNYLLPGNDIGKDGLTGSSRAAIARDAYGYTLDYYKGDYKPIASGVNAFTLSWTSGQSTEPGRDLYNGNISRSTLAVKRLKEDSPVGYTYRYDQLNRMKGMRQHPLTVGATGWNATTAGTAYKEDVTYDGNGNILTYLRNGSGINGKQTAMDQLTYGYQKDASGNLLNNKLLQVKDNISSEEYVSDLHNQADNNYIYDKIGNLAEDKQANITRIQWTVYGKIKLIQFSNGSSIEYRYDPSGNRVYKQHNHDGINDRTWYVRDAQGNVLTVYGNKSGGSQLYWKEQHLYGSSRLGIWNADLLSTSSAATISSRWLQKGNKQFELSNHLGNVLAVITDKAKDSVIGGVVDHYEAEMFLAQDYYPFGMLQPDRQWRLANYRYGFNNKENDTEVKGNGNQQDYGMRVYDPRLGKFQSIDPLTKSYPELTPYQFANNTPIQAIDLDGGENKYYLISISQKTGKAQFALIKEEDTWFGENPYWIYKGKEYYFGSEQPKWLKKFSGFSQTAAIVDELRGKNEQSLDQYFAGVPTRQEVHARNQAEAAKQREQIITDGFVTAWAVRRAGLVSSSDKQVPPSYKVDLMGGEKSRYGKEWINYDINAKEGVKATVKDFRLYFGPSSVKQMIVDNPRASFLEDVTPSIMKGGTLIIRGGMSNSHFNIIFNEKAAGMKAFEIIKKTENVPNIGYKQTDGIKPVAGQINEIILQKK
ncbi:RHS repeat-associated core domain-containing protein [Chitinophaga tropicalis]|uniref:DUF6443 domain-containing protein n=1 Tax=Chitinophaga tropicalis TaxID=2683588 RepID=A0A7K1U2F6_9BACT|nr:RHS repeat-associated core domain-containing protein [Chitinophaga tropicalis]MVT08531.1 hypothetical protein [Chitinophaga tropicalis]